MTTEERQRLAAIKDAWLRPCGACDAGLHMNCTCPDGDPRSVISFLVDLVEYNNA